MALLARTVNTPLAIEVRRGAVAELGAILSDRRISGRGEVAVVVGPAQGEAVAELVGPQLRSADLFTVEGGTLAAAQELGSKLRQRSYDAVVGIGGGKTIDVAKWAAAQYGTPMVSVATSLAHDGLASPVASLDNDGGRGSYGVHIPIAVVVDLDFVVAAPLPQLRAGVGDLVSNLNAVADWRLAQQHRAEPVDGLAVMMAAVGAEAVLRHPGELTDLGFLTLLAESLIGSGLAMAVCGSSRPSSGGCHEISHAMDLLFPGTAAHGEQVALGALFCTFLRRDLAEVGDPPDFTELLACLLKHGLPTRPADLGLTREQFVEAVLAAPATRPDRYTILEHLDLDRAAVVNRVAAFEAVVRG
ncbi:iron-containing alcohol dehydrogenase family protein [Natronosporangium hydrolyticum]|uniref:Iron-containing alcohol dehydrogenase family protein n=1 Tax=Natronosporangium hydrolyticum TaxID=2811111 RepID=A0A895YHP4_9ACTN|nr:iron-containing alcohol dehydrogenase family protein [Natronosporangium hydrolyticum]QSB17071.1 iron-containing alcohol dehydrogenase family protein [Natronosporangium hydrolyticum]